MARRILDKVMSPLVSAVREKREQAKSAPSPDTLEVWRKRYAQLRQWIPQGKTALWDDPHWSKPDADYTDAERAEFDAKWRKLIGWLIEYELLVVRMAQYKAAPPETQCRRCGSLIVVAWQSNDECERCTECEQRRRFYDALDARGYVVMACPSLDGERIAVVRSEDVELPAEHRKLVRFTVAEVRALSGASADAVRKVYAVKREIGGQVVEERQEVAA